MDDSEGHTYRPCRLCVELPTEMIIRSVPHTVTHVPHSVQDHVTPRTVCRVTLLTPQVPQKGSGVRGPAGQLRSGSTLTGTLCPGLCVP